MCQLKKIQAIEMFNLILLLEMYYSQAVISLTYYREQTCVNQYDGNYTCEEGKSTGRHIILTGQVNKSPVYLLSRPVDALSRPVDYYLGCLTYYLDQFTYYLDRLP